MPRDLTIKVVAKSRQDSSTQYSDEFKIPFAKQFRVILPSGVLTLYKDQRTERVEVVSNTDFKVKIDATSDTLTYNVIDHYTLRSHYYVEFTVPNGVTQNQEIPVTIYSPETNEREEIRVKFQNTALAELNSQIDDTIPDPEP